MQAIEKIPGYEGFERLSRDGVSELYKAIRTETSNPVLIKVIYPDVAGSERTLRRIEHQGRVAKAVKHENIVGVVETGFSDGARYIVREYYDGRTVADLMRKYGPLPLDVCSSIVLGASYGLEAAHTAGVIHFDIRPANLVMTSSGIVKVKDFGLEYTMSELERDVESGVSLQKPPYMSPEEVRGELISAQADIFSLGVVAYEMLANARPFLGPGLRKIVSAITDKHPVDLCTINPIVPRAIEEIVSRMMAKSRSDRYKFVPEVLMDMEEAIDKYDLRVNSKSLKSFYEDPEEYRTRFNERLYQQLARKPLSVTAGVSRESVIAYFRKLYYLNPEDMTARAELNTLGVDPDDERNAADASTTEADTVLDESKDYRVFLDGIAIAGSEAGFALKLSMRLKTPLPHIRSLMRTLPSQISGTQPYKKARKLAAVIEELGGVVRLEAVTKDTEKRRKNSSGESAGPSTAESGVGDQPHQDRTSAAESSPAREAASRPGAQPVRDEAPRVKSKPEPAARPEPSPAPKPRPRPGVKPAATETEGRQCLSCGHIDESDAAFCSRCFEAFINGPGPELVLEEGVVSDNPLAPKGTDQTNQRKSLRKQIEELPPTIKWGGLTVIVLLVIFSIIGH